MKILVISSCTGKKATSSPKQLILDDFKRGPEHVRRREAALQNVSRKAVELYTGRQHFLLKQGLEAAREVCPELNADLRIVSAGYGVIPAGRMIAPYEATFSTMTKKETLVWGETLKIRPKLRWLLRKTYDLVFVLLGDPYLTAAQFNAIQTTASPTIVFCSGPWASRLLTPERENFQIIALGNQTAKRFHEGLTSIKGMFAARIITSLVREPQPSRWINEFMAMGQRQALDELDRMGPWKRLPDDDEEE